MTKLLTLIVIVAIVGQASFALAAGRIVLRHEAIVPHAQVVLSDVAELESVSRTQRDKLEALTLISMGDDQIRQISRDVILIRLDQAGFDLAHFDLVGADATDVLLAKADSASADVEPVKVQPQDLAPEPVLTVDEPGVLAPGIEVSRVSEREATPAVAARAVPDSGIQSAAEPLYRVVVLRRPVPRGHVFRKSDLTYVPTSTMPDHAFSDVNQIVGATALRAMDRNTLVAAKQIGRLDVVKYESVRVMVEGNGFVVEGLGKALEGGMVGETINVLNLNSRKSFKARVSAAGVVHAQL